MAMMQKTQKPVAHQIKAKSRKLNRGNGVLFFALLFTGLIVLFFNQYLIGLVGYNHITSEGSRVGQVTKLSHNGVLWKTWEGTLSITQTGAYASNWNFSIDSHDPNMGTKIALLKEAADDGSIVKIDYMQHFGLQTWRAKTSYTATDVTVLDPGQKQRRDILREESNYRSTP
jgi:hypothetical protein